MKLGLKFGMLAFLMTSMFACVSTKDETSAEDDSLAPPSEETAVSDADVEKALEEVGGPIDDASAAEASAEPEAEPAPVETTSSDEPTEPVNAIQQDDLESYKLDDQKSATTPVSAPEDSLEGKVTEEKQPDLDLSAPVADHSAPQQDSFSSPVQDSIATTPATHDVDTADKILYPVRPGESLSMIAKKLLGSVKAWKRLAKFNGIKNANRVNAGAIVQIPVTEKNRKLVSNYVAKNTHTVTIKRGDTLAKIASRVLGTKKAWKYLWKNNESVISNPHRIEVGTVLSYLGSHKAAGVARKGKVKSNTTH